jgi:hypothetical protein
VATPGGAELTFHLSNHGTDLHGANFQGGDLVEFEQDTDQSNPQAVDVRLVKRWIDDLNDQYRPLVNEFHSIVQIAQ